MSSHRSITTGESKKDNPVNESFVHTIASQKIQLSSGEEKISAKHFAKMLVRATNPDYIGK